MARKKKPVCIYVDNSNIYIGAKEIAKRKKENPLHLRIAFDNFIQLVTGGDLLFNEMVWAGSGAPELENTFKDLTKRGIDLQIIPRSKKGENETVDMAIQLSMYRYARKYRKNPGIIVLCTGDGKGYHEEKGFLYDLTGFIKDGWKVHLYSWNTVCHKALKNFAKNHGTYTPLEKHYRSITFVKKGRVQKPIKF